MKPILVLQSSPEYLSAIGKLFDPDFSSTWFSPEEGYDENTIDTILRDDRFVENVYLVVIDTAPNPYYDCWSLIKKLKSSSRTCKIPLVVFTTKASNRERLKTISLDVDGYFTFPLRKHEMVFRLNKLIDHYLEAKNIQDGLQMMASMRAEDLNHAAQQTETLEKILHAQETVNAMSRKELEESNLKLQEANQKLHEYYETQLQTMKEKSELQMMFGKYISPTVLEYLLKHEGQRSIRGEKRDVSILFSDLRGFTTLSETMEPSKVVVLLNEFFTELTENIIHNNGMVDKYQGDNIMALFGAPLPLENHYEHVLLAAISMRRTFKIIQKNWRTLYKVSVGMGIGINSGPAIVGNLGSYHKISYTAIGDTVNTAARFEKHALDGQIVFGDDLYRKLSKEFLHENKIRVTPLGTAQLKGKKGKFTLYTALTPDHLQTYPGGKGIPST